MKMLRRFFTAGAAWFDRHKGRLIAVWIVVFSFATIWLVTDNRRFSEKNRQLTKEGRLAYEVQCAQRLRLKNQIAQSQAFLDAVKKDPSKAIPNIPNELIEKGIQEDRAFLSSFDRLRCPEPK